jgi:hypothetical protein
MNSPSILRNLEIGSVNYNGGTRNDLIGLKLQNLSIAGNAVINGEAGTIDLHLNATSSALIGGLLGFRGGVGDDKVTLLGQSLRIGGVFSMIGSSGAYIAFIVPV